MLLRTAQVVRLGSASHRDWRSVRNWIFAYAPLVDREQLFILRKQDLVTMCPPTHQLAGFDSVVEAALFRSNEFLSK